MGLQKVGSAKSIAATDAIFAVASLLAAYGTPFRFAAIGYVLVGIATTLGTLRHGVDEGQFRRMHEVFVGLAGKIGVPLIGLGFAHHGGLLASLRNMVTSGFEMCVLGFLVVGYGVSLGLPAGLSQLYRVVMTVVGVGFAGWWGLRHGSLAVLVGVGMFVAAVLVERQGGRTVGGVLKENWFHLLAAGSFVLLSHPDLLGAVKL